MSLLITSSEIMSVKWLSPVVRLVYDGNYKEALTLAEYYPVTSGRRYVQLAAHLGQYARTLSMSELKTSKQATEVLNECETIAKSLRYLNENEPRDFASLVNKISPTLLGTVFRDALRSKKLYLAQLCLISIGLLKAKDPNAHSVKWLELVETCFTRKEIDLCENSLRYLFSLEYEAPATIQVYNEARDLRLRRQLIAALRDQGFALSPEHSGKLLVELLKADLQFSQDEIDSFQPLLKDLQNPLAIQLGTQLAYQVIFSLRQICTDLTKADDRIAATIIRVEKLARIDFKQLASEYKATGDLLQITEQQRQEIPERRQELISKIVSLHELLTPFTRDLIEVGDLFLELENVLHSSDKSRRKVQFENLLRLSDLLRDSLRRNFPSRFFDREWAEYFPLEPMAEVIERLQSVWLTHLPQGLIALSLNIRKVRRSLEEFADRSQDVLQDPFSYRYVLEQLPEIRKQQAMVKQEFSDLAAGWNDYCYECLKPLPSESFDLEDLRFMLATRPHSELAMNYGDFAMSDEAVARIALRITEKPSLGRAVERYTKIDFPEVCTRDKKVELRIQLMRQLPVITRVLKKLRITVGVDIKEIALNVVVTAPAFALQKTQQPLKMPIDGDSEEIVFNLYPAESGDQVIEIEFFYDNSRIGHVLVKTHVGYWAEDDRARIALLKDPIKFLELHRPDELQHKLILHVTWLSRVGELHFKVPTLSTDDEWVQSSPELKSQIEDSLRELNAFLTEAVSTQGMTKPFWESICLNLKAKGAFLFNTLIPKDVIALLSSWPGHSILAISTNEQWIPWELMFDGDDFWGKKYMLTRYPRPSDHTKWPREVTEHGNSRVVQKVVNVIGGGLQIDDSERAGQLFKGVSSRVTVSELREKAVAELSTEIATADVIHCTCHGLLHPHLLRISKDGSRTQNLLPETVRLLPLQAGTLVFANACSSAAAALLFGTFNSFGWEFYLKGAEVFIGTLGAVPTKYAIEFAEIIYAQLFNAHSIGQALTKAREEAEKKQNIFWLLYCVYGDPDYVLKLN